MTVVAAPVSTFEDLVLKYAVTDPRVQARIELFELYRDDRFGDMFPFLGAGADRKAHYDAQTNLVYKYMRDHYCAPSLAAERESLDKAHHFLASHPEFNIRYAETQFYTADSGNEYLVQEYVPTVGQRDCSSLLPLAYREAVAGSYGGRGKETGLSEDYIRDNVGFDEKTGMTVLTDMLYTQES